MGKVQRDVASAWRGGEERGLGGWEGGERE